MNTYTRILYHITFATRDCIPCFYGANERKLHGIIWALLGKYDCHPYAVDGCSDHIHIATHVPVTISLSDIVKNIKIGAGVVIKNEKLFPLFQTWGEGYLAFSHSLQDKDALVKYVHDQKPLHRTETLRDEYRRLLNEHEVQFKEDYLL